MSEEMLLPHVQCSQAASRTAAGIIHITKGNMFLYVISELSIDHGDLQVNLRV